MDGWDNLAWYQEGWVPVVGAAFLTVAVVAAVAWFIDGIVKYAYWWHKEEE
ncbi:MAG: hypothetical protein K6G18_06075 [Treponema sp.]|nr:hypothetical protein [Treponema sp.]